MLSTRSSDCCDCETSRRIVSSSITNLLTHTRLAPTFIIAQPGLSQESIQRRSFTGALSSSRDDAMTNDGHQPSSRCSADDMEIKRFKLIHQISSKVTRCAFLFSVVCLQLKLQFLLSYNRMTKPSLQPRSLENEK